MASVQERLNLKRQSLSDKWSAKERLLLASAVAFSGDQNWMSVSRALKMICNDSNRPADWFSQKFCAIEYGKLLENVETPKRKKRTASERDSVAADTPGESIVRKLTQERIEELQKVIEEERREFNKLRDEVLFLQSGNADEAAIMQMWEQIEVEKKQKEQELQMREKWMREREERKLEMERAWRPSLAYQQSGQSPKSASPQLKAKAEQLEMMDIEEASPQKAGTSPLLTSLLKSPSPAPNANQILHPGLSSPSSRAAPTITNLLTSGNPVPMLPLDTPPPQFQPMHVLFPTTTPSAAAQAPTLTKLLDNRTPVALEPNPKPTTSGFGEQPFSNQQMLDSNFNIGNENDENSDGKDEENLMEVFKNLIPDDLADILSDNNEMILNPELLDEDKMLVESLMNEAEGLPIDDVEVEPVAGKPESEEPAGPVDVAEPELSSEMFVTEAVGEQAEAAEEVTPADSVVVIDDSPKSEEKPISEGVVSDAEPLPEIEENVVMEILSDEDEKQAIAEEAAKNEVEVSVFLESLHYVKQAKMFFIFSSPFPRNEPNR
jgi:bromodomain-containing protein 8